MASLSILAERLKRFRLRASVFAGNVLLDDIVQNIRVQGWCVIDDLFTSEFVDALVNEAKSLDPNVMKQAGIGRKSDHKVALNARGDRIQWIDSDTPVREQFLEAMEALRTELNRKLILGLWDYEAHFARYEEGAFYEKHLDAFTGKSNRVLSTVLYLNNDWQAQSGGEFVLYDDHDTEIARCLPQKGRFAIFLSEAFPHEVKPAYDIRHSIAGWFRVNNNTGKQLDPYQ